MERDDAQVPVFFAVCRVFHFVGTGHHLVHGVGGFFAVDALDLGFFHGLEEDSEHGFVEEEI